MATVSYSKRCIDENDFYLRNVNCFVKLKIGQWIPVTEQLIFLSVVRFQALQRILFLNQDGFPNKHRCGKFNRPSLVNKPGFALQSIRHFSNLIIGCGRFGNLTKGAPNRKSWVFIAAICCTSRAVVEKSFRRKKYIKVYNYYFLTRISCVKNFALPTHSFLNKFISLNVSRRKLRRTIIVVESYRIGGGGGRNENHPTPPPTFVLINDLQNKVVQHIHLMQCKIVQIHADRKFTN